MEQILLKKEVEIENFDDNSDSKAYLLSYKGRFWKISSFVAYIIKLFKENQNLNETYQIVSKENPNISYKNVESVYDFLLKNGLLIGTSDIEKGTGNKNLWGKVTIIPSRIVNRSKFLKFMFNKKLSIFFTFFELIMILYIFFSYDNEKIVTSIYELEFYQLIISFLIIILLGLVHEFGHSVALISQGQNAGDIGMGVYLYMPVFYSNVTNAWKLKRMKRVCVDIGGIYFQAFVISISYIIIEILNKNSFIKSAIIISTLQIIGNFNPFIKMDGYWMLCDWFGITNPYKVIIDKIGNSIKRKKRKTEFDKLNCKYKILFVTYTIFIFIYFVYLIELISRMFFKACIQLINDFKLIKTLSFSDINIYKIFVFFKERFVLYLVLIFVIRWGGVLIKKRCLDRR